MSRKRGRAKIVGCLTTMLIGGIAGVGLEVAHAQMAATEFNPQYIYATTASAVVFVAAFTGEQSMAGAGSIIHPEGFVLTNAHVVVDKEAHRPYQQLWVFLKPEHLTGDEKTDLARRVKAQLVAFDSSLDLALLRMEQPPQPLSVVTLGDATRSAIGERVAAIGHPEQGGLWSLTTGVISAEFDNFQHVPGKAVFQTETSLNRGNSGGPLLNADGQQVGINTAIARLAKDGLPITSVNFSLKSNVAQAWLAQHGVTLAYGASGLPRPLDEHRLQSPSPVSPSGERAPQPPPRASVPRASTPATGSEARGKGSDPVPPPRPFNLDRLVKGLGVVEQDLEHQMQQMDEEIRRRR